MPNVIESGLKPATPPQQQRGRGRRWPFRPRSPEDAQRINAEVSRIMAGVEDMIYQLVRKRVHNSIDEDSVSEIVQRCRIWLWQRSLPKYDAWRGVKVSTFLYRCAGNFINQEVRALTRHKRAHRKVTVFDADLMLHTIQAADHRLDDKIEAVAQDVLKNPEKYLTESQVAVFKAITQNPGAQMKGLACKLGYRRASSLSTMLRRIRERIAGIDIENHDDGRERE